MVRKVLTLSLGLSLLSGLPAAAGQKSSLEDRVAGADSVVVATARSVTSEWRTNEHGDRLIVSRIQLDVSESLKGPASRLMWLEVEGGTLDGFTLQVSSLPLIHAGERGVFFLDSAEGGSHAPHQRGEGIFMLDEENNVRGTTVHLDEFRSRVRSARQ